MTQSPQQNPPGDPAKIGSELGMIEDIASSVSRMQVNEDFDAKGLRTIWHRGKQRTEMLSWEGRDKVITRQELSIFGLVVELRAGHPVRTGRIPDGDNLSASGQPMSHLIKMDAIPDEKVLTYASHLLRHVRDRDAYTQHLLREVNDAIAQFGFDASRTAVAKVDSFGRERRRVATLRVHDEANEARKGKTSRAVYALIAAGLTLVGAAIGLGVAAALGLLR